MHACIDVVRPSAGKHLRDNKTMNTCCFEHLLLASPRTCDTTKLHLAVTPNVSEVTGPSLKLIQANGDHSAIV